METLLIQGKQPSAFDTELLRTVGASDAHPVSGKCAIWFGVKNETGQMYRTIGVTDLIALKEVLDRLRQLDWWVEVREPVRPDDLHFIVKKSAPAAEARGG